MSSGNRTLVKDFLNFHTLSRLNLIYSLILFSYIYGFLSRIKKKKYLNTRTAMGLGNRKSSSC